MFGSKVVFVLGAGASAEIEFPVGRGLADLIIRLMDVQRDSIGSVNGDGDMELFRETAERFGQVEALRATSRLREGLPFVKSIDEFLD